MKIRYAPLAVACALMVAATAQAAAVTYYFGGVLDTVDAALPSLTVGNSFVGSFTFESTASDAFPNPSIGNYDLSFAIDATVNGYSFSTSTTTTDCPACGGVQVQNNINGHDVFAATTGPTALALVTGPSLDGFSPVALGLLLSDASGAVFDSDALPSTLSFSSFDNGVFIFTFGIADQRTASGALTYLTTTAPPIPETSTTAMLALGLSALAFVRRKVH